MGRRGRYVSLATLSAREGKTTRPNQFEFRHGPDRKQYTAHWVSLPPLLSRWLAAEERIHYDEAGKIDITITAVKTGEPLFQFATKNLRMWKTGADFEFEC